MQYLFCGAGADGCPGFDCPAVLLPASLSTRVSARQAHPDRAQNVMEEFSAIREAHKSAEPETLDAQEATYRNDTAFMNAVNAGLGRMLDGALLVRKAGGLVDKRARAG